MGVRIDEIKADFETYAYRDKLDDETVKRYQQIIDDLPPVDLFDTKEGLILAVCRTMKLSIHRGKELLAFKITCRTHFCRHCFF